MGRHHFNRYTFLNPLYDTPSTAITILQIMLLFLTYYVLIYYTTFLYKYLHLLLND
ncbi:hypothetical protein MITSMUL_04853 [Mitsuokella multacida DSM 20544]|uniref:Uncharacterized protein n=1 Tax=Mitsuokella multacida DSM 20544 TaxID=500635 RepID=C9KN42_9FIRM|nr:hypothetical protein MITSMUL_04853 [Mitsuokella multacida DSM 20544]